jgi:hypothetical protein
MTKHSIIGDKIKDILINKESESKELKNQPIYGGSLAKLGKLIQSYSSSLIYMSLSGIKSNMHYHVLSLGACEAFCRIWVSIPITLGI